jgi:hypothetical protein
VNVLRRLVPFVRSFLASFIVVFGLLSREIVCMSLCMYFLLGF